MRTNFTIRIFLDGDAETLVLVRILDHAGLRACYFHPLGYESAREMVEAIAVYFERRAGSEGTVFREVVTTPEGGRLLTAEGYDEIRAAVEGDDRLRVAALERDCTQVSEHWTPLPAGSFGVLVDGLEEVPA